MNGEQASDLYEKMIAALQEGRRVEAAQMRQKLVDDGWCPDCLMRWHQCLCSHEED